MHLQVLDWHNCATFKLDVYEHDLPPYRGSYQHHRSRPVLTAGKQKQDGSNGGALNNVPMSEPPQASNDGAVGGQDVNKGSTPDMPDGDVAGKCFSISTEYFGPL